MRQAGTLSNRDEAQRFADYLLTQGISARVEPDADRFAVWVRDEDQLARAKEELAAFVASPNAERFRNAESVAEQVRKQQLRDERQRRKNFVELRDRWDTRPAGRHPITLLLIAASVFVFVASDFGTKHGTAILRQLWLVDPGGNPLEMLAGSPMQDVQRGHVWRLITPIFIHANMMHIVFNMYWLYNLGGLVEIRKGSWRFLLLVLVLAVTSNYAQAMIPYRFAGQMGLFAAMFCGMSGVVYGLFGYIWMKSRWQPEEAMFLPPLTVELMLIWLVLCWTGVMGPIANWAHTVGLAVGMAIGYAPVAWRRLLG
jgi:GlpG protein